MKKSFLFLIFLFLEYSIFCQKIKTIELKINNLPHIEELASKNIIFKQYCQEVEESYQILAQHKNPSVLFFTYKPTKTDTLLTVSSRCSLPYETIATLNGIENQSISLYGKELLLPTVSGIFINANPSLPYEQLLYQKLDINLLEQNNILCYTFNGKAFYFFKGERFSPTERSFFLDSNMKMPLKNFQISSDFGMRISPISGNWKFHQGIDMASPEGTDVFACQNATVQVLKELDSKYGNYIVLNHGNGTTSLYAHLSSFAVKKGDTVFTGQLIGKVGHTGMATGPHLHFEVRQNDVPANPQELIEK